jgi:hypothetical protein
LSVSAGAGAGNKAAHAVHVWDRTTGALLKILEGPKDPTEDLDVGHSFSFGGASNDEQWHPCRPILATVSDLGVIHIWVNQVPERWAAYAPGFEELNENKEYIEAEDEFDVASVQTMQQRKQEEQNIFVDIFSDDALSARQPLSMDQDDSDGDPDDDEDDFVPLAEDEELMAFKDNGPAPVIDPHSVVDFTGRDNILGRSTLDPNRMNEDELLQVRCARCCRFDCNLGAVQMALARIDEEESKRSTRARRRCALA